MQITNQKDFITLLKGATFLAAGGGGPFSLGKELVESYFKDVKEFEININSDEKIKKIKKYLALFAQTTRRMKHICTGKVTSYATKTKDVTDLGYLTVETDDKRVFTVLIQNENVLISQKLAKGEDVYIHVVAIEAADIIRNNEKLMSFWNEAYKTSRYYGSYNSKLWS